MIRWQNVFRNEKEVRDQEASSGDMTVWPDEQKVTMETGEGGRGTTSGLS